MKLIILDRDGVVNYDSKEYIKSPDEWQPLPGSLEAISLLNSANFTITIATNQSGLARGLYNEQTLTNIHNKMHNLAKNKNAVIDSVFYCPHGPDDGCTCRKPNVGLLSQIAKNYGISLENVFFLGDSLRDVEAAINFGAKPVLVLTGNGERYRKHPVIINNQVPIFTDLLEFSKEMLSKEDKSSKPLS
jgi:D-glycero-D-manno-heptose 1,7-bisphosphate phosphatase